MGNCGTPVIVEEKSVHANPVQALGFFVNDTHLISVAGHLRELADKPPYGEFQVRGNNGDLGSFELVDWVAARDNSLDYCLLRRIGDNGETQAISELKTANVPEEGDLYCYVLRDGKLHNRVLERPEMGIDSQFGSGIFSLRLDAVDGDLVVGTPVIDASNDSVVGMVCELNGQRVDVVPIRRVSEGFLGNFETVAPNHTLGLDQVAQVMKEKLEVKQAVINDMALMVELASVLNSVHTTATQYLKSQMDSDVPFIVLKNALNQWDTRITALLGDLDVEDANLRKWEIIERLITDGSEPIPPGPILVEKFMDAVKQLTTLVATTPDNPKKTTKTQVKNLCKLITELGVTFDGFLRQIQQYGKQIKKCNDSDNYEECLKDMKRDRNDILQLFV